MLRKAAAPKRIYELKITLKDSKPPIWRRVEVADDITLARLQRARIVIVSISYVWSI